jgi:hypothetical protein
VGMGGNKKTTTTRGIKLILVPIWERVSIYLHTHARFEVPVLRPISDLMLETKLERSKRLKP